MVKAEIARFTCFNASAYEIVRIHVNFSGPHNFVKSQCLEHFAGLRKYPAAFILVRDMFVSGNPKKWPGTWAMIKFRW